GGFFGTPMVAGVSANLPSTATDAPGGVELKWIVCSEPSRSVAHPASTARKGKRLFTTLGYLGSNQKAMRRGPPRRHSHGRISQSARCVEWGAHNDGANRGEVAQRGLRERPNVYLRS